MLRIKKKLEQLSQDSGFNIHEDQFPTEFAQIFKEYLEADPEYHTIYAFMALVQSCEQPETLKDQIVMSILKTETQVKPETPEAPASFTFNLESFPIEWMNPESWKKVQGAEPEVKMPRKAEYIGMPDNPGQIPHRLKYLETLAAEGISIKGDFDSLYDYCISHGICDIQEFYNFTLEFEYLTQHLLFQS